MTSTEAEHAGLLADIIASPADDAPRLIYADWCEDHGEPERAEFIRVQCELVDLAKQAERTPPLSEVRAKLAALSIRADKLAHDNRHWIAPLSYVSIDQSQAVDELHLCRDKQQRVIVRRGFVHTVRCKLDDWLTHGEAIAKLHPVERVKAVDRMPYQHLGDVEDDNYWGWYGYSGPPEDPDDLPRRLWELLGGSCFPPRLADLSGWKYYRSPEDAHDALSDALLLLAREEQAAT